ncbi:MAG: hypothetical protein CMH56_07465 [Myxococcales bacterium]|nr:hypothetical protein [Myxococcales bacterium]
MVDGPLSKLKIGAVVQARMGSTRLPDKVMMPIPGPDGPTLLGRICAQLNRSERITDIIIATTSNPIDDKIEEFTTQSGIPCFRGDENNVFERYQKVSQLHDLDIVIRVTGDNPIIDTSLLDETIRAHQDQNNHYTRSTGLPIGMNFEIISGEAFKSINAEALTQEEQEHVTLCFKNHPRARVHEFQTPSLIKNIRLTIDYPADIAMFSLLFAFCKKTVSLKTLNQVAVAHPWIFKINQGLYQKRTFKNTEEEIDCALQILAHFGMKQSADIFIQLLQKSPYKSFE